MEDDDSSNPLTMCTDSSNSSSATSLIGGRGDVEMPRQTAIQQCDSIIVAPQDFSNCDIIPLDDSIIANKFETSRLFSKSYPLMNPSDYEINDSQTIHKLQSLHNREINSCIGLISSIQHKNDNTRSGGSKTVSEPVEIMGKNVKLSVAQYKQIIFDSKIMSQRPVVLLPRLAKRLTKSQSQGSKQAIYESSLRESVKKSSHSNTQSLKKELKPSNNVVSKTHESRRSSADGSKRDEAKSRTKALQSANGQQPMSQTQTKSSYSKSINENGSNVRVSKSNDKINDIKAKFNALQSSNYIPKPTALSAKNLDRPELKKTLAKTAEKPKSNIVAPRASSQSSVEKNTLKAESATTQQSQPQQFKIPKLNTKQSSQVETQSKITITKISEKTSGSSTKNAKKSDVTSLKRTLEQKSCDPSKKLKVIPTTKANVKPETTKPKESVVDNKSIKPAVPAVPAVTLPPVPVAQSSPTPTTFAHNYPEFLTLSELNTRCVQFNESIGLKESFYLLFLMDAYKKKLYSYMSIDMDTLIKATCHYFGDMSIAQISHLHSLMSKTLERINHFHLFNHDSSLREYSPSYKEFLQSTWKESINIPLEELVEQLNPETNSEAFLAKLDELTLSESYILLSRISNRLNQSYRSVRLEPLDGTDFHTIKVEFENNMIVESDDMSIEASVRHVLHSLNQKESHIFRSLNKFVVSKPLNGSIHLNLDCYGKVHNQVNDTQLVDSVFVEQRTNRIISAFHSDKLSILEIHKTNYTTINSLERVRMFAASCNNENQAPRFVQHLSQIKSQRGFQRRAQVHKMLSQDECDQKLKKLRSEKNIVIDKT